MPLLASLHVSFIPWDMYATIRFTKLSYSYTNPLTEKLTSKVEMTCSLKLKSLLRSISNCKNQNCLFWCCRVFFLSFLRHSSLIPLCSEKGHLFHMILGHKRRVSIVMVYNIWTMAEWCIPQTYQPLLRSSQVCGFYKPLVLLRVYQNCKLALTLTSGSILAK